MGAQSQIQWTDATFNPWIGCTKVSEGCKFCYAEQDMDKRRGRVKWGPLPKGTRILTSDAYWKQPLKWNREAAVAGERRRVFCSSLADVFEDWQGPIKLGFSEWIGADLYKEEDGAWSTGGGVLAQTDRRDSLPLVTLNDVRIRLFELIEQTPALDWQLLTKRPENVMDMVPPEWYEAFPPNVWLGTSCEDQKTADERIPHLLQCPAAVRFLSCEPLLGPIDLSDIERGNPNTGYNPLTGHMWGGIPGGEDWFPNQRIGWVICGGESGPNARPMHPDWARSLRDQCQAAGVPYFFKQWGEYHPRLANGAWPDGSSGDCDCLPGLHLWLDGTVYAPGDGKHGVATNMKKVGKHRAGRLLDDRAWDQFPEVRS